MESAYYQRHRTTDEQVAALKEQQERQASVSRNRTHHGWPQCRPPRALG